MNTGLRGWLAFASLPLLLSHTPSLYTLSVLHRIKATNMTHAISYMHTLLFRLIYALSSFASQVNKVSAAINNALVPKPTTPYERMTRRQREIEDSAKDVRKALARCVKMQQTYEVFDIICLFRAVWGHSAQVTAAFNSLILELHIRQDKILNNL